MFYSSLDLGTDIHSTLKSVPYLFLDLGSIYLSLFCTCYSYLVCVHTKLLSISEEIQDRVVDVL